MGYFVVTDGQTDYFNLAQAHRVIFLLHVYERGITTIDSYMYFNLFVALSPPLPPPSLSPPLPPPPSLSSITPVFFHHPQI